MSGSPSAEVRSPNRRLVVVVVPDFTPTIGGTVRQATLQAQGMLHRGYRVVVLTRRYDRGWPSHAQSDGLDIVRFGLPGRGGLAEKLSLVILAAWFARRRHQIVLVQSIMYSDYALAASAVGLRSAVAVVWAAHGEATDVLGEAPDRLRSLQRGLRRSVLFGCHHVALTGAIRDELTAQGLCGASIAVIPVPVDVLRFRPPSPDERAQARADLGIDPGELVVTFTGRFVRTKGVDRLIEAFARLRASAPRSRLLLVGGGSDQENKQVRADAARWQLADSVIMSGVVVDVERSLWASDIFVLPSVREGLSNSLVEAMACGLPCVAGAEAGGDQVLYSGAGLIPASSDVSELYQALVDLSEDEPLRRQLGRAAVQRTQSFTPDRVAARYEDLVLTHLGEEP